MKGKWLTGALVLAMAAVTLAGCGAKDETKEKVEQGKKGNCCLSGYNTENEKNKFRLAIMEDTVIMIL